MDNYQQNENVNGNEQISTENLKEVETTIDKCPECGGTMAFDPATHNLKCNFCGAIKEIEKNKDIKENDIMTALKDSFESDKVVVWGEKHKTNYQCNNCGAVMMRSKNEVAMICPFCSTTNIIEIANVDGVKPQVVVPFSVDQNTAELKIVEWLKTRFFSPNDLKSKFQKDRLIGVYEPSFTFDSNTDTAYVGRVGDRRTRTVGSGKNRRTETYIAWRHISGNMSLFYDDVYVATSKTLIDLGIEKILPFRDETSCVFDDSFLTGYMANHYTKGLEPSWNEAKAKMDAGIREEIKRKHSYDVEGSLSVRTNHSNVKYKYVLLPIYIYHYNYKGKEFTIYENGSTGKIVGKAPLSPIKVAIASLLALGLIGLVVLLFTIYG